MDEFFFKYKGNAGLFKAWVHGNIIDKLVSTIIIILSTISLIFAFFLVLAFVHAILETIITYLPYILAVSIIIWLNYLYGIENIENKMLGFRAITIKSLIGLTFVFLLVYFSGFLVKGLFDLLELLFSEDYYDEY